jgi:hypothetical protein
LLCYHSLSTPTSIDEYSTVASGTSCQTIQNVRVSNLIRCDDDVCNKRFWTMSGCIWLLLLLIRSTCPSSELDIDYGDSSYAEIVRASLNVDEELKPEMIERHMSVRGSSLHMYVISNKETA